MDKWKEVLVKPEATIIEVMKLIDQTTLQFAAVVDRDNHLLGTVTDGDIRRGILNGESLDNSISTVMNIKPVCEQLGKPFYVYKQYMKRNKIKQLPIISNKRQLHRILFSDELTQTTYKNNKIILMAGGLGTRLRPLTENLPKPMLNVGSKPILETIIDSFKNYGFTNFILTVNYKKEVIKDYFQDGHHLGVTLEYIEEEKRLGTAGALSLLNECPSEPVIVMNGDLLTSINFEQLLDFHKETEAVATMCVREYEYQIPYGVIETDQQQLVSITEKPIHKSFVNAGVYVLNPEILKVIPKEEFYDMPELFKELITQDKKVSAFPLREYWMDIGRLDDYDKANEDYLNNHNLDVFRDE